MTTPRDDASPRWCRRLTSELDAADARAIAVAGTLTPRQLAWTPQPGHWSVGQCLEHICIASDVYLPALAKALEGRPSGVVQEITPGWFGRWFIRKYFETSSGTTRLRAPKKIAPAADVDPAVLERFLRSNRRARALVDRASRYDVNRIRFRNPFVPVLRLTVGTGLEILVTHQRRHLLQAERIRTSRETPSRVE